MWRTARSSTPARRQSCGGRPYESEQRTQVRRSHGSRPIRKSRFVGQTSQYSCGVYSLSPRPCSSTFGPPSTETL
jgi:hypothetical protein